MLEGCRGEVSKYSLRTGSKLAEGFGEIRDRVGGRYTPGCEERCGKQTCLVQGRVAECCADDGWPEASLIRFRVCEKHEGTRVRGRAAWGRGGDTMHGVIPGSPGATNLGG